MYNKIVQGRVTATLGSKIVSLSLSFWMNIGLKQGRVGFKRVAVGFRLEWGGV
jgi:hypothetical protein